MTAKEFVIQVQKNQPNLDYYKHSFSEEFYTEAKNSCTIKTKETAYSKYNNELLNLIHNYDVSMFGASDIT